LLGIYPAIGLISVNISQMKFLDGIRSLLVGIVFSLVTFFFFRWLIKDQFKSSLMTSWFFLIFYSYGHVYDAIEGLSVFNFVLGRHRILYPIWIVLMVGGLWLIYKSNWRWKSSTKVLNWISVILLVIPMTQIGIFEWQRTHLTIAKKSTNMIIPSGSQTLTPDIYYIILDGYARDDMLLEYYALDISDFIDQLEALGFYIPRCSQSNYGMTALSLSSSLNMDTVDHILPDAILHGDNIVAFNNTIVHNQVRQTLENMGYQVISFQNDIWWTEWSDSDYFITLENKPYELITDFGQVSKFEILFLRTTALRVFEEAVNKWLLPILSVETPEEHQAELILLALDGLENLPEIDGPKFVFAHIIAPHEPYVFNSDGEFVITESTDPGYPDQIRYLNKRLISLVQSIIEDSDIPPIIILQADHGRDTEVRMANFMALYFPGEKKSVLYPTLTPVNIFRLVLNNYLGQDLPLLPDVSYFSFYDDTYNFTEVTYPCDPER